MNSLKRYAGWILNILLLSPLMPKLGVNEDVVVYPYEVVLGIAFVFIFVFAPSTLWRTATQRGLLLYIFIIAVSTLLYNMLGIVEMGGWLKLLKLMLYIAVPAVVLLAQRGDLMLKQIAWAGIAALALNLYLVIGAGASILGGGLAFDIDMISGGLSGKFFNLQSLTLESTGRLSHGVWATYCAFLFAVFSSLFIQKKISIWFFVCFCTVLILNVAVSISREGLLLFVIILAGFSFAGAGLRPVKAIFRPRLARMIPVMFLGVIGAFYAAATQIGQKFIFMLSYLSSGGVDDNLLGRLNTWHLTWVAVSDSFLSLMLGFGYNLDLYGDALDRFSSYANGGVYSHVPESLFFTALTFGGLLGVFALIKLIMAVKTDLQNAQIHPAERVFFTLFFIGLLLTNILSGATATSDLVMLHILLLLGLWADLTQLFGKLNSHPGIAVALPRNSKVVI